MLGESICLEICLKVFDVVAKKIALGGGVRKRYPTPTTAAATAVMRGNKKAGTRPEIAVRRAFRAAGLRFRVNHPIRLDDAKIRPDIVFPAAKIAVFVDGCFWHGCKKHGTMPKSNKSYWAAKIGRNVARDRKNDVLLKEAGWRVIRIWEHSETSVALRRIMKGLNTACVVSGRA